MRLRQLLSEVLNVPLYDIAREALEKEFNSWLHHAFYITKEYSAWDHYDKQRRIELDKNHYSDEYSKIRDDQYQAVYDALRDAVYDHDELYKELMSTFINMVEETLRKTALEYIETTVGKIEPFVPSADVSKRYLQYKQHLYWLQHLVVHLDTEHEESRKGVHGHFQRNPNFAKDYQNEYNKNNINPKTDLGAAIKIYMNPSKVWNALYKVLMNKVQIILFGEPQDDDSDIENFLEHLLPLYVHETTHLAQYTRTKPSARGDLGKSSGLSYLPNLIKNRNAEDLNINNVRGSDKRNKDRNYRVYKAGRRGKPSRLPKGYSWAEYIEYLGSTHEIGAWAAGAAAEVIHDILPKDQFVYGNNPERKIRDLNHNIDEIITDIQHGYYQNDSIRRYADNIKSQIEAEARKEYSEHGEKSPIKKVDIGYRKVWRKFITKLINNLLAYKKDIPEYKSDFLPGDYPE